MDKVTTGTNNLVLVILKVIASSDVLNKQFSLHYKVSSKLQFTKGVSKYLKELLKYFKGTKIFTFL